MEVMMEGFCGGEIHNTHLGLVCQGPVFIKIFLFYNLVYICDITSENVRLVQSTGYSYIMLENVLSKPASLKHLCYAMYFLTCHLFNTCQA